MASESLCLLPSALFPSRSRDSRLERIPLLGVLGCVCEAGSAPGLFYRRDINVVRRRKHKGVFGHLVVEKSKVLAGPEPGIEHQ